MNNLLKYYISNFIIIAIVFLVCNCDINKTPFSPDHKGNMDYPTILYPLTQDSLQQLQEEFDVLNENKICSRLNDYGLTGYDYCLRTNPKVKIFNENAALKIAVNTLVKNSKFTNVTDSLSLVSCGFNTSYINDDSTHWGFIFRDQDYQGIKVANTNIRVTLYGDGVFNIDGFWYKDICIPAIDEFSKNQAKGMVVGEKIIWSGFGGEPHEFIVSDNSIGDDIEKTIYPLAGEESIELRVTWKTPIIFDDFVGWYIYLDTTTGEIIKITQQFVT